MNAMYGVTILFLLAISSFLVPRTAVGTLAVEGSELTAEGASARFPADPCGICSLKVTDTANGLSVDPKCTADDDCEDAQPCTMEEWVMTTPTWVKRVACTCGGVGGDLPDCQDCWSVVSKFNENGPWTEINCAVNNCLWCCVVAGPYYHTVPCGCSSMPCPQ